MHLPPPVHGAAVVGQNIKNSKKINQNFECRYINLSASKEVKDVGKINFSKLFFLIGNTINIIKQVIKFKPNLCYITPSSDRIGFYRDFITITILKIISCKIVVHFHNKADKKWIKKSINKFLYKSFFKGLKVILLAKELKEEKAPFIKNEDIYLCPNGMPFTREKHNIIEKNNDKTRILFLSNMIASKGVWILFEACKILKEKGYQFHCDFIGKWFDISEENFKQKITENNLDDFVTAHGPVYGNNKNAFFEKSNIFVFPTYYHGETFGLVLLEAMQYGLPCISTKEGGIPSVIVDNETGYLIPPQDPNTLADKILQLIENPNLQEKMGKSGMQRYLQYFTIEKFEDNMIRILNDCIKRA